MNILFLSLTSYDSLSKHNIYTDLLRKYVKDGHSVYAVCPVQKRLNVPTTLIEEGNARILRVRTGNVTQVGIVEKGISTIMICPQFISAIKKYFSGVKFDLIIYPTPPITLEGAVKYIKKRDGATSYLLLKDIFPQNAADIGMMSKSGIIYKYFRAKEKKLYKQSDFIGCMSQANVEYVLKHNPFVNKDIVHVAPNSTSVFDSPEVDKTAVREKFGIPQDARVFLYGGNLGKPQDIPFVVECLKKNMNKKDRFFAISGKGTDYKKIKAFFDEYKPENMLLINGLPHDEYEDFANSCDVGLIFLDHRFTIPNFPSRLLAYMRNRMPVLAATDPNTDIGKTILDAKMGWWCESNDAERFTGLVDEISAMPEEDLAKMGENGRKYMTEHFDAEKVAEDILRRVEK